MKIYYKLIIFLVFLFFMSTSSYVESSEDQKSLNKSVKSTFLEAFKDFDQITKTIKLLSPICNEKKAPPPPPPPLLNKNLKIKNKEISSEDKDIKRTQEAAIKYLSQGYKARSAFLETLNQEKLDIRDFESEDKIAELANDTKIVERWRYIRKNWFKDNENLDSPWDFNELKEVAKEMWLVNKHWYKAFKENHDVKVTSRGEGMTYVKNEPGLKDMLDKLSEGGPHKVDFTTRPRSNILSTSANKPKNNNYAQNATLVWIFSLPPGHKGRDIGKVYSGEDEITFPSGTQFKITEVFIRKGKQKEFMKSEFGKNTEYIIHAIPLP
ncbi:MAG: hypothetical protein HQK49_07780 [Oligoflexia bacterium]|nr:hypothetical protein [Oligoflexia bacterium]